MAGQPGTPSASVPPVTPTPGGRVLKPARELARDQGDDLLDARG
jgi:hypothetical protein